MKAKLTQFYLALLLAVVTACGGEQSETAKSLLPVARGEVAEIILVMDSAAWKGPLGSEIRKTFSVSMAGLPQDEPLFELKHVAPRLLNGVLKSAANMIFVTTLNNNTASGKIMKSYYTQESLDKIQADENLYYFTRKDNYARGQEILYLFGKDEESLIRKLRENRESLQKHFEEIEKKRLLANLFKVEERDLQDVLHDRHNFEIRLPYGYELVQDKGNFIWLRHLDVEIDKTLFVYYQPYTSQEVFNDITSLRSTITEKYLRDVEKDHIYVTYQKELPFITKEVNFNGNFAIETRGLWKTSDSTNGGPFISYTFVDKELNRLYYIEGHVYAPSKDKRDFIRELQAVLQTFKTAKAAVPAAG